MPIRTGASYMGHHNPRHVPADLRRLAEIGCDDVLLAAQENDFVYMRGKVDHFPRLAREHGLRPIAIFWGALNVFGGGKSSQFLLSHPECHQVRKDGSWNPAGCYNNPACVRRIEEMIDRIAELEYEGYFIDEPTVLDCYCATCRDLFSRWHDGDLDGAEGEVLASFRRRCVNHYVETIAAYIKKNHAAIETFLCLMPQDRSVWSGAARVPGLDNLGTDLYWVNDERDVEEMGEYLDEMDRLCREGGKIHHEWFQCWGVKRGREHRIREQGEMLVRHRPAAIYVWAFEGQVGTSEACEDPEAAWAAACEVLRSAKEVD